MEFKSCKIGTKIYGDDLGFSLKSQDSISASPLPQSRSSDRRMSMNLKQGTTYSYQNKNLENVLFESGDSPELCGMQITSANRSSTLKLLT